MLYSTNTTAIAFGVFGVFEVLCVLENEGFEVAVALENEGFEVAVALENEGLEIFKKIHM